MRWRICEIKLMFSEEILDILKRHDHRIDSKTYINIIKNSPQINHIIYKPFGDYYEAWDDNGIYFLFSVYYKK